MDPSMMKKMRRRPMASVQQLPVFKREIIEKISPAGFEVLLADARLISEGKVDGDHRYYGSSMFTLDLSRPGPRIRTAGDPATAERMVELLKKDRKLKRRLEERGLEEASRIAGQALEDPVAELRMSIQGARVLLDVDVEGQVASAAKGGAGS